MKMSGQFYAPVALLPPGQKPKYPLNRRLGGPRTGQDNVVERINDLSGFELRPLRP